MFAKVNHFQPSLIFWGKSGSQILELIILMAPPWKAPALPANTKLMWKLLCSALLVKQRCLSNDFIVINDDPEKVAMHFYV